jgi:YihY family inner membrane protein
VKLLERVVRRVDGFQRRHMLLALPVGVVRKFGDDKGSSLAALVSYYGFLALFPLLLVLVTVLGIVAGRNSSVEKTVVGSAVSQFPIIGTELSANIHALSRNGPVSLTIGLLAVLWGALGVTGAAQRVMAEVWNVKQVNRPGFWPRLARGLLTFAVLGVFILATSFLAGTSTSGFTKLVPLRVLAGLFSVVLNTGVFVAAFRVLTPPEIPLGRLWPGAVLGGVGWSVLQALGGYLVGHQLRNTSQVYGFFAVVLGAMWWIYLGATLTIYAAELNAVLFRRLWPRSITQPPLTPADEKALAALVVQEERRPEQEVTVRFRRRRGRSGAAANGDAGRVNPGSGR